MYHHFSFVDLWSVVQGSKSIGAEVNWGVRFKDLKDVSINCKNGKRSYLLTELLYIGRLRVDV